MEARHSSLVVQSPSGWFQLLRAAWQEYERDYARYYAMAMVFYALIALVPLLLLLLGSLGLLLQHSETVATRAQQLLNAVEAGFGSDVRDTVERLSEQLQHGSLAATILSFAGLLLTGSKLFHHLRMTFRAVWKHESPLVAGPFRMVIWESLKEKSKAFLALMASGVVLILAFMLDSVLNWIALRTTRMPWIGEPAGVLLATALLLVLAPLTFALLFRYMPPVKQEWRHVWLASVLCGVVWLLGFELVALYGANFGRQFGAYGALGGVLVAMLWMNVIAQVMFIGAELCKVTAERERAN